MNQPVNLDFSAYIAERTRDFTGREWLFATIDRWLTAPNAPQIFLIAGEPGIGKTAISARLTQFSASDAIPPTDYVCVGDGFLSAVHFCSARNGGWISPDGFARSLSAQLAARYPAFADALASDPRIHIEQKAGVVSGTMIGVQITNYYAETSEALFNDLVRMPLQALCRKSGLAGPLTILVDGLDESLNYSGRTNIVRLLAACWDLPPQVRLLLTSRPVDGVLEPFRPLQPFILYARSEENRGDVGAYVSYRFEASAALREQAGDEAQVEQVRGSLVARSRGNFLVVSKVLDGVERGELSLDDPEALPAELQDLYASFLDRLTRGDIQTWRSIYRPVLGALAVAQEPVDVPAVCCWAGLTHQRVTDALHDLRELFDPALDGSYRLYHESVVDFLTGNKAGSYYLDVAEYHRQIAASYTQRFIENGEAWSACDIYGLRHLSTHLFEGEQVETLQGLLFDFEWLQSKLEATDISALLTDFDLLPVNQDLQLVQGALQLAAHVLAQDKTQLASQLLGRLLSYDVHAVKRLLEWAKLWNGAPWLCPLTPSLVPPGGPLLLTLMGHTEEVKAVAVTPDGRRAISASRDRTLKVWDVESGQELRTLTGHTAGVTAVAVTPDGRQVISASEDKTLKVWDLESGQELRTLTLSTAKVEAVAVTPNGQRVISTWRGISRLFQVWDLENGQELRAPMARSDGDWLDTAWPIAVTADGRWALCATAGYDTLEVWDLQSGDKVRTLESPITDTNGVVAVTPDGLRAISASEDHTLKVWGFKSGEKLHTLAGHLGPVTAVAVTPDAQRAISVSEDHTLKVWDLQSGQELHALRGHAWKINEVAVTPDGRRAISASDDKTLKVWDLRCERGLHAPMGHTGHVWAVAVTPDGRRAISGSANAILKVWDLESGQELRTLRGHTDLIRAVTMTSDRRQAISGSSDNTLKVWDLESGQELRTLRDPHGFAAMAVTADGRWAISASVGGTLKVWDLQSGQELRTLAGHTSQVRAVAVTPDGRQAVSASVDETLKVWDLESGEELRTLTDYSGSLETAAVAGDGRRVISSSWDSTLKVWDLRNGQDLRTLTGHSWVINAVAMTLDGRWAISASDDQTLKVWDLESGSVKATFSGDGALNACAVAQDEMIVIAGGALGQVHFLRLEGMERDAKRESLSVTRE
jgi:WD40 repeat protein